MPIISIYVNDQIYEYLQKKHPPDSPSKVGETWIEERYAKEVKLDEPIDSPLPSPSGGAKHFAP